MLSSVLSSPSFLRAVLWFDAATGVALGALHLLLTPQLAHWLGLAPGLLVGSGVVILLFAALAAFLARARPIPRAALALLAAGNFAWALGSLALLLGGATPAPTGLGQAYLAVVHGVSVALLAELQWWGLRRLPRLATAGV